MKKRNHISVLSHLTPYPGQTLKYFDGILCTKTTPNLKLF